MNRGGSATINNPELATLFAQVQLFAPTKDPLAHIRTAADNTDTQGWTNRGSVRTATSVGTTLWYLALLTRTHKIHSSMRRIAGLDNKMVNAASCMTHLTDKMFICHFTIIFPHRKPWRMLTLPSG